MTHTELCKATAEWAITPPGADWLALYEYQSFASTEFPDVLTYYNNRTTLYEIKISRSDFIADPKKESRELRGYYRTYSGIRTHTVELYKEARRKEKALYIDKRCARKLESIEAYHQIWCNQDKTYKQWPHLGQLRYYVCVEGLIDKSELPNGWGLIYFKEPNKFKRIVESGQFRADMNTERAIIAHALRGYASGNKSNILVRTYDYKEGGTKLYA